MKKLVLKFFLGWGINILAIYASSVILINFNYDSWQVLVLTALGFSVFSLLVRPFLKILSLPFPIVGPILIFVVNSFAIYILSIYVKGFHPGDMVTILEASGIISVTNFVLHLIIR